MKRSKIENRPLYYKIATRLGMLRQARDLLTKIREKNKAKGEERINLAYEIVPISCGTMKFEALRQVLTACGVQLLSRTQLERKEKHRIKKPDEIFCIYNHGHYYIKDLQTVPRKR